MPAFPLLSDAERANLWACLALRHATGVGATRARQLVAHYGTPLAAVEAGRRFPEQWVEEGLASARTATAFAREEWRAAAREEWLALQQPGIAFVTLESPLYPPLLRQTPDSPLLLYYQGNVRLLQGAMVAIVGSRYCTEEGINVSALFSRGLSECGITVVSGMARGIDRAAHIAAMRGPGRSVAVLGTGITQTYPPCNSDVADLLREEGLLVSEFAPGTVPRPGNFPVRNRIISGLCHGTLVVEASKRSGSLITARLALEQGREVFVVPGPTRAEDSAGCRDLVRNGAKAVFTAEDMLPELAPMLAMEMRQALQQRIDALKGEDPPPLQDFPLPLCADPPDRKPPAKKPPANSAIRPLGNKPAPVARPPAADQKNTLPATPPVTRPTSSPAFTLSPDEQAIATALADGAVHIDGLCRGLGMDASRLSGLLTMLEVRGVIRREPGMFYTLG